MSTNFAPEPTSPAPKPSRQEQLKKWSQLISVLTAVVAMAGSLFLGLSERFFERYTLDDQRKARLMVERITEETRRALGDSRRQIDELQKANDELRLQLRAVTSRRGKPQTYAQLNPSDRELITQVKTGEDQLQARLGNLEGALMNSPEKALSTFVMKQQVDALQDRSRSDMESVHGEMGRLFTLTEWCLGLMFTIALGVFGLALTNLRKTEKGSPRSSSPLGESERT